MVLESQKPTQSNRHGEVAEDLPGSNKSVARVKRNSRELGRPSWFLHRQVSEADQKTGELKTSWESESAHSTQGTGEPFTGGRG